MAEKEVKEFNWDGITAQTAEVLKAPKVAPVPDAIRDQAQRSYDGVPHPSDPEKKLHVLSHRFGSDAQAAEFARLMKLAGPHTTPPSSVQAVVDPFEKGDNRLVHWRAGAKRGRSAGS